MTEKRYYLKDFKDFTVITLRLYDRKIKYKHYDWLTESHKIVDLLNDLHEENQLLKEEKELLKNKLDRIEDILPHYLSCAEISEFRGKTVKEDLALMKCWNKRYQK